MDNWKHRSDNMKCKTCMSFKEKERARPLTHEHEQRIGRCRRHAPTLEGWPVVFESDWCGDHKLTEEAL